MDAKEIYQDIMKFIKYQESLLTETQELNIFLLTYPSFEVTTIGRMGNGFLFFGGQSDKGIYTTLLLPAEKIPLHLRRVDLDMLANQQPKRMGFLGDVEEDA